MLAPAIMGLTRSSEIILAARTPGLDYFDPLVELCLDFERGGWHGLFTSDLSALHSLSLPELDLAVAFLGDPDGRVRKNLRRLLPGTSISICAPFAPEEEDIHAALYLARCLQEAGCPLDAARAFRQALCRPLLATRHRPEVLREKVVLHPGSGSRRKNLDPAFWLRLMEALKKRFATLRTLLLLGPAEEPLRPCFEPYLRRLDAEVRLCPKTDELKAILQGALIYFGHDSGVTHLSAMLGAPTVALFRAGSPDRWRPLGPAVKTFEAGHDAPALIRSILAGTEEWFKELPRSPGQSCSFNVHLLC
jgi:hypothetical protein